LAPGQDALTSPLSRKLSDIEADHIRTVMRLVNDNKTRAARALGISPATLWRKLKRMNA
jgi:two-component system, NtrC family, response regulator HydG